MKAFSGIAENVNALPGWIVWALKIQGILNFFQSMNFVLHVSPDRFPVADGQRQTRGFKFQGIFLAGLRVVKANAEAVLTLYAIFSNALRFRDPGHQFFPRDEDRFFLPLWHKTHFSALTVESGGDYRLKLQVLSVPDTKAEQ